MRLLVVGALLFSLVGCGQAYPEPECDTNPHFGDSALRCEAAVETALGALPADHPAIEQIQFLFGSATPCCSTLRGQGEEVPIPGYVVFTYGDAREYVPVAWWHDILTAGSPAPY